MHDPRVPETLEGWSVLHQMFRVRWWPDVARPAGGPATPDAPRKRRRRFAAMARGEEGTTAPVTTCSATRATSCSSTSAARFEELQAAQLAVARLGLSPFLEPTTSYVSVVELGMYEMTAQIHARLGEQGLEDGLGRVREAFDAEMEEQRKRVLGPALFRRCPRGGTSASTR